MSLKLFLLILVLTLICFVIGLYAGGWAWFALNGLKGFSPGITTLFNQGDISLTNKAKAMLPWAWCVTAAITFLPTGISLLAMLGKVDKSHKHLHGNARFANRQELRKIWYTENEK